MVDVKHFEDCEQLFFSVGKCFVIEAERKILDKFLEEFIFIGENKEVADGVWCYGVNIMKSFLVLADFKDAVSTGNGGYIPNLRKQLLTHFFATPGFN
jgi:hypothetical protein